MMDKQLLYQKWKLYQFYVIAAIVSLVMLIFVPMIGSDFSLTWNFPTSAAGWIVYIVNKLLAAGLNLVIFHCFVCQAKTNSLEHPNYKEACKIMEMLEETKEYIPKSPKQYFGEVYGKKGVALVLTTLVAALTLSQAVLSFDITVLITHFFTLLGGLICGIFQMNQVELFWQEEFLRYAKYYQRQQELIKKEVSDDQD